MAQKKFSRLSIMLEARDKMSGPIKQAANASSQLQNRVNQLSKTLNKSKTSMTEASVSNRVLSEKYAELARRVSSTDEKMKLSAKVFRSLPASIRLAAYTVEGFSKSLINFAKNNMLAKMSIGILNASFKVLNLTAKGTIGLFKMLGKGLMNFTSLGYVVKAIIPPLKYMGIALWGVVKAYGTLGKMALWPMKQLILLTGKAAMATKNLAVNMLKLVGKIPLFRVMGMTFKDWALNIQSASQKFTKFVKNTPYLLKGTKAWYAYSYAVDSAKKKIVSTRLAFELWKNSSKSVEKVSNAAKRAGEPFKKLYQYIMKNVIGIGHLGNSISKTGNRGRATFNQMVDSNARLNREIQKLNRELSKADSKLGKMKGSMSSLNTVGLAFSAAYAGQAAYGTAQNAAQGTIGKAMEQQYSSASIGILAGDKKGEEYYKSISNYASTTAYATEDWAKNMRSAVLKSKDVGDLKKYMTVMDQLATMDPAQGLEGAALAVRELNSGDITSLVERFELPRSTLKTIKGITDPVKQIEALSKIIGDTTGYSAENIQKMKDLPLMQWQKLTNTVKTFMGYIGKPALKILAPVFERLNKALDSGKLDGFVKKMGSGLGNAVQGVINFVKKISSVDTESLKQKFQPFITLWNNMKDTITEAWPKISDIFTNVKDIFSQVADKVNNNWPTINSLIQKFLDIIKGITGWVDDHFDTTIALVGGLAAAMAAFKVITAVSAGWTLLTDAIMAYRGEVTLVTAAQWLLNAAMDANPIGLVVIAIGALVAAGIYLYQNWDTVKIKMQSIWQSIQQGAATMVNGIIDSINWMIKKINAIPGVSIPTIDNVNWGGTSVGGGIDEERLQLHKHHGGLDRVPYDGYPAVLHKGERVQTRNEVREDGNAKSVLVSGNTFVVRQDSDIDAIANALFSKLNDAKTAMG